MTSALLPTNATLWERSLADAMPVSPAAQSAIGAIRGAKLVNPTPSMLPYLVWEYGLGELTPYVPNLYELLSEGLRWQRLRGTVSAVAIGLAWIGYTATIDEASTSRRFWNSFQLRFPTLPANDNPDLERIEGITGLSVPLRSKLRRGVHQYDVGPVLGDASRFDAAMLEHESGIAVTPAGTLWSFGRTTEIAHSLHKDELVAAGVWIEPNWLEPLESSPAWMDLGGPWVDMDFPWVSEGQFEIIERIMLQALLADNLYLRLEREDGSVIGYRRCRAARPVKLQFDGAYRFGSFRYDPTNVSGMAYVDALTGFDDVDGELCAAVALVWNATRVEGVKPGRLWLEPGDLEGGHLLARTDVNLPLRRTVRERIKFLLDFAPPPVPSALEILGDTPNGLAIDFTDNSFAQRVTPFAEIIIGEEFDLAIDFTDNSYAERL